MFAKDVRLTHALATMMPASGSDGSCWSKVAEMQQLRMPPHERQWSTTLFPLSRSRTPPSRSQHLHSCTLEDRVAARIDFASPVRTLSTTTTSLITRPFFYWSTLFPRATNIAASIRNRLHAQIDIVTPLVVLLPQTFVAGP